MLTTEQALQKPTEELRALRKQVDTEMGGALHAVRHERPSFSPFLALKSPGHLEEVRAAAEAWDLAHPGVQKSAVALEQLRADIDAELMRRDREDAVTHYAESALEDSPRVLKAVQAGMQDTPAWDAVREWGKLDNSWCLLLLGGVGCGKSTATGAWLIDFVRARMQKWVGDRVRGESVKPVWVRAVEASRHSGFGIDTEKRLALWRSTWLLVIDDMGTELMTPTWQQVLDDVLDYRYQQQALTILPSNLSADEFKARYGARITDRIRHDGTVRTLDAKSMRKRLP